DPQHAGTLYAAAIGNIAGRPLVTVYKSRDGGASWNESGSGLPTLNGDFFTYAGTLTIDPKNPSTLYVTKMLSGAYKSTDGGASWRTANSGLPTTIEMPISGVVIDPQN